MSQCMSCAPFYPSRSHCHCWSYGCSLPSILFNKILGTHDVWVCIYTSSDADSAFTKLIFCSAFWLFCRPTVQSYYLSSFCVCLCPCILHLMKLEHIQCVSVRTFEAGRCCRRNCHSTNVVPLFINQCYCLLLTCWENHMHNLKLVSMCLPACLPSLAGFLKELHGIHSPLPFHVCVCA